MAFDSLRQRAARRHVGFDVAQGKLNPVKVEPQKLRILEYAVVVPERAIEDSSLAVLLDPCDGVILIFAGSFVFGLSALLYGECTIKDGAVEQSNYHDYPSMLIEEMPRVDVIVMPSGGFWGGIGEPTIAVAAPAVLNAIFAATGKRIRQFPLKDVDLRAG